jgi:threonine aldolase
MNFKSDNYWGVHPSILEALVAANTGAAGAYGNDTYSEAMRVRLSELFEHDVTCFLVGTGTVCNSLCLTAICPPYGTIYATDESHINTDECLAPSLFTGGSKLVTASKTPSKLDLDALRRHLADARDNIPHQSPPFAISVTQSTELGLVYSLDELRAIGAFAKEAGLKLHLDGARFGNAVAALGCSPAETTWKIGVDIMSFGVTKGGGLMGEVVVIFNQELAHNFEYIHKRAGQLLSKTRFFAAQVIAYLKDDLWLKLARNANAMAQKLNEGIVSLSKCRILYPVQANEIFVAMDAAVAGKLREKGFEFYDWPGDAYRLVTSWATTDEMVGAFIAALKEATQ